MTETPAHDRERRARELEERAQATIMSILSGGDLGEETLRLSNTYTDEVTAKIRSRLRRS